MPENLTAANFLNMSFSNLRKLANSDSPNSKKKYQTSLSDYICDLDTDAELNNAKAYFNLAPQLVTADLAGVYHYVSTRNNDFSNRDQKGQIIIQPFQFQYQLLGLNGYTATLEYEYYHFIPRKFLLFLSNAIITFPDGSVTQAVSIKYGKFTRDQLPQIVPENGQNIAV